MGAEVDDGAGARPGRRSAAPAKGAAAPAARGAAGGRQVHGNLAQIMRAIPFPNSNILFDVQDNDPAKKKPDAERAVSRDLSGMGRR